MFGSELAAMLAKHVLFQGVLTHILLTHFASFLPLRGDSRGAL